MPPEITTTIEATRRVIAAARRQGKTIGLVPTMGALHEGHASLFRLARKRSDFVVASIFVNPAQFAPHEDFHRYPRPFEDDVAISERAGVDLVFHPEPPEIYPPGFQTYLQVEKLQRPLCGITRPTHFRGVATVVLKLLNIVQPDLAYFGQKDAQQARLLSQMVRDLDVPVEVIVCPIVRETDGLAMSSRNRYLSPDERAQATVLHQSLMTLKERIDTGERDAGKLRDLARGILATAPLARVDYVEIVDWQTLDPLATLHGEVLIALAVFFGTTRLIDNVRIDV